MFIIMEQIIRLDPLAAIAKNHFGDFEYAVNRILNHLYSTVKKRSEKVKGGFSITEKEFIYLCVSNCRYCGAKPSNVCTRLNREKKIIGKMYYSGIDRIDSSLGYVFTNCLSSCWDCNRSKNELDSFDFMMMNLNIFERFPHKMSFDENLKLWQKT